MKRRPELCPPVLTAREAETIGRAAALNRWRARVLRNAAFAVGVVLDSGDDLPDKVRDNLRDALVTITWWELDFAAKGGGHDPH